MPADSHTTPIEHSTNAATQTFSSLLAASSKPATLNAPYVLSTSTTTSRQVSTSSKANTDLQAPRRQPRHVPGSGIAPPSIHPPFKPESTVPPSSTVVDASSGEKKAKSKCRSKGKSGAGGRVAEASIKSEKGRRGEKLERERETGEGGDEQKSSKEGTRKVEVSPSTPGPTMTSTTSSKSKTSEIKPIVKLPPPKHVPQSTRIDNSQSPSAAFPEETDPQSKAQTRYYTGDEDQNEEILIYPSIHHLPSIRSISSSESGSGKVVRDDSRYGAGSGYEAMMYGHMEGYSQQDAGLADMRTGPPQLVVQFEPDSWGASEGGGESVRGRRVSGSSVSASGGMMFGTIEAQVVSSPSTTEERHEDAEVSVRGRKQGIEGDQDASPRVPVDRPRGGGLEQDQNRQQQQQHPSSHHHLSPPRSFSYPSTYQYSSGNPYAPTNNSGYTYSYPYYPPSPISSSGDVTAPLSAPVSPYTSGYPGYSAAYYGYAPYPFDAGGYPASETTPSTAKSASGPAQTGYSYPYSPSNPYAYSQAYSFPASGVAASSVESSLLLPPPSSLALSTDPTSYPYLPTYWQYHPGYLPSQSGAYGYATPAPSAAAQPLESQAPAQKRYQIFPEVKNAEKARGDLDDVDQSSSGQVHVEQGPDITIELATSSAEQTRIDDPKQLQQMSGTVDSGPVTLPPRPPPSHMPYQEFLNKYSQTPGPGGRPWMNPKTWWPEQREPEVSATQRAYDGRRGQSEYVRSFSDPRNHRYGPVPAGQMIDPATYPFQLYANAAMPPWQGPDFASHNPIAIRRVPSSSVLRRRPSTGSKHHPGPSTDGALSQGQGRMYFGSMPLRRSSSVSSIGSSGDRRRHVKPPWQPAWTRNMATASETLKAFWANPGQSYTLEQLSDHLIEFALDLDGSRLLLNVVRSASPSEQASAHDILLKGWLRLSDLHHSVNLLLQLLDSDSEEAKLSLRQETLSHVVKLLYSAPGTRILEKALTMPMADAESYQRAVIAEITPILAQLVSTPGPSNSVQKLIEIIPAENIDFLKAVPGLACQFLSSGLGCNFIVRLIRSLPRAHWAFLVHDIVDRSSKLVLDAAGNYVLQALLEAGSPEDRSLIVRSFASIMLFLSCHRYGSHVIEKALERGSIEDRTAIVSEFLTNTIKPPSTVRRLLRDTLGNYVLQAALRCVPDRLRQDLRTETQKCVADLQQQFFQGGHHPHASLLAVQAVLQATECTIEISHEQEIVIPTTPEPALRSAAPDNDSARPAKRIASAEDLIDLASSASSSVSSSPTKISSKLQFGPLKAGRSGGKERRGVALLSPLDEDEEHAAAAALIKGVRMELEKKL